MVLRMATRGVALAFFFLAISVQSWPSEAFAAAASPSSSPTKILAVYEPWFGHPRHIDVGYSSQDPLVLKKQIAQAKSLGIAGFVVDWYGDREPFIDKSYSLMQRIAGENAFTVAMMYDETDKEATEATDDALVAFDTFREKYLAAGSPGQKAYLTYKGRPDYWRRPLHQTLLPVSHTSCCCTVPASSNCSPASGGDMPTPTERCIV